MKWAALMMMVMVMATACRSTKTIQTVMSRKDSVRGADSLSHLDSLRYMAQVYSGIQGNRIEFQTFSAKVKVEFEGSDGKKNDFNAVVRMKKDSVLWVSVNAMLGFEAFRIMITPDSVKVLNKLDKIVQLRSVEYLNEITKLPFRFAELQDLMVGNPLYLDSAVVSYRKDNHLVSMLSIGHLFKHLITVRESDFAVQHSKLDDVDPVRGRSANITYGDYELVNGRPFSTFRKITVLDKTKLDIQMKFKQVEYNGPLNFPFSLPKNYKLQ